MKFNKSEKFCMKIFEVFGLQNFNVTKLNEENFEDRGTLCRFWIMLIRLSVILTTIFFVSFNLYDAEVVEGKMNPLMGLLMLSIEVAWIIMMFVITLGMFFSTKKLKQFYMNYFSILKIIRDELSFLDCDAILSIEKKPNNLLRFSIIFLALTILFFAGIGVYKGREYLLVDTYLGPNLLVYITVFHFVFLVDLANHCLVILIEIVDEMGIGFIVPSENNDLLPMRMIEDKIRRVVKTCRRIYNLIYENCEIINEIYGKFLVLINFIFVASITLYGYLIYVKIIQGSDNESLIGA